MQLYLAKHGRDVGNARINIGSTSKLMLLRKALFDSPWFSDAIGGRGQVVFQPDGKLLLPSADSTASNRDIEALLKNVRKQMGEHGRKAVCKYVENSTGKDKSEIKAMVRAVFGEASAPVGKGSRAKGESGGRKAAPAKKK